MTPILAQALNFDIAIKVANGGFVVHASVYQTDNDGDGAWIYTTCVFSDEDTLVSFIRRTLGTLIGPDNPGEARDVGPFKVGDSERPIHIDNDPAKPDQE